MRSGIRTRVFESPECGSCKTAIRAIDPASRSVRPTAGDFTGDVLVVAPEPTSTRERRLASRKGGHEFYTVAGGFAAREGARSVGAAGSSSACSRRHTSVRPPPSETALLLHEHLTARGLRRALGNRAS